VLGVKIKTFAEMLAKPIASLLTLATVLLQHHLHQLQLLPQNVDSMEVLLLEECSLLLDLEFFALEVISFIDGEPEENLIIENSDKFSDNNQKDLLPLLFFYFNINITRYVFL